MENLHLVLSYEVSLRDVGYFKSWRVSQIVKRSHISDSPLYGANMGHILAVLFEGKHNSEDHYIQNQCHEMMLYLRYNSGFPAF